MAAEKKPKTQKQPKEKKAKKEKQPKEKKDKKEKQPKENKEKPTKKQKPCEKLKVGKMVTFADKQYKITKVPTFLGKVHAVNPKDEKDKIKISCSQALL